MLRHAGKFDASHPTSSSLCHRLTFRITSGLIRPMSDYKKRRIRHSTVQCATGCARPRPWHLPDDPKHVPETPSPNSGSPIGRLEEIIPGMPR